MVELNTIKLKNIVRPPQVHVEVRWLSQVKRLDGWSTARDETSEDDPRTPFLGCMCRCGEFCPVKPQCYLLRIVLRRGKQLIGSESEKRGEKFTRNASSAGQVVVDLRLMSRADCMGAQPDPGLGTKHLGA